MKKLFLLLLGICALYAKDYEIQMLDLDREGNTMVFSPSFIRIQPGDTVTFIPTHKTHYVQSKLIPDGAEHFLSELDEKTAFKFDKEGIYIYVCPPHQMMNMIGIIQVGNATNIQKVRDSVPKLDRRALVNKGRLIEYAKAIQE
ncbi:MAG: pseudoazurin [Helicobacter sp.]|nr:pseudoazurin [Helicobacter sp.]